MITSIDLGAGACGVVQILSGLFQYLSNMRHNLQKWN